IDTARASPGATVTPPTRTPRAGGSTSMRSGSLPGELGDLGAERLQRAALEVEEAQAHPPLLLGGDLGLAAQDRAIVCVEDIQLIAGADGNVTVGREDATVH